MNKYVQVTEKTELSKLLWRNTDAIIPCDKERHGSQLRYADLFLEVYTTTKTTYNDSGYEWYHYDNENDKQRDIILVTNVDGLWCIGGIIADTKYTKTEKCGNLYKSVYTNADVIPISNVITATLLCMSKQKPIFSVYRRRLNLPEQTFKVILRGHLEPTRTQKLLRSEAERLYDSVRCWPIPNILLSILCKEDNQYQNTWYLQYPQNIDSELLSCDVITVLKHFPFMIRRRLGTLTHGVFTIETKTVLSRVVFIEILERYLLKLCQDARLAEFVLTVNKDVQDGLQEERKFVKRLNTAVTKSRESKRRLSTSKQSEAPPCIKALYIESAPWNNEIRFQLAIVLKSVASEWCVSVDVLSASFVAFMRESGMTERRIRHLNTHLNRSLKADSRLCVTRRHKLHSVKREIHCYYGGGTRGVELCLAKRKFSANTITPENATISNIWAYSYAEKEIKK